MYSLNGVPSAREKKKILLIWNYFYFPWEKGKSRFSDLAIAIIEAGYELEVVCSSFYHMDKCQRSISRPQLAGLPYKIHLIYEPGYQKNVSLRRIRSIAIFNEGVRRYLSKHAPVDLVYVPVPSCKTALIARKWSNRVGAKLVVDVEDLWPESFRMVVRPRLMYGFLAAPMMCRANRCYRKADAIVGVSDAYVERALRVRTDAPKSCVAPIGSDFGYVQDIRQNYHPHLKSNGEFWITYIGTLGSSYDIQMSMDACNTAYLCGHTEIVLNILGSGPDAPKLLGHAKKCGVPIRFYDILPYDEMMKVLFESDLGLNPIVKGSMASLINKVGDYAAAGLPVLNSQECSEYIELLQKYNAGISVSSSDEAAFTKTLLAILDGRIILSSMKLGALQLGAAVFSRKESERKILELIDESMRVHS